MVPGRRFSDRVERSLGVGGGKKRWGRVVVDVLWTGRLAKIPWENNQFA